MAFLMREGKMASNVLDSMLANAKAEKDIKDVCHWYSLCGPRIRYL